MDILINLLKTYKTKVEDFSLIDEIGIEEKTLSGIPHKMLSKMWPELKTPEERIKYFRKKIKEIGPISKYSGIEDEQ